MKLPGGGGGGGGEGGPQYTAALSQLNGKEFEPGQ